MSDILTTSPHAGHERHGDCERHGDYERERERGARSRRCTHGQRGGSRSARRSWPVYRSWPNISLVDSKDDGGHEVMKQALKGALQPQSIASGV